MSRWELFCGGHSGLSRNIIWQLRDTIILHIRSIVFSRRFYLRCLRHFVTCSYLSYGHPIATTFPFPPYSRSSTIVSSWTRHERHLLFSSTPTDRRARWPSTLDRYLRLNLRCLFRSWRRRWHHRLPTSGGRQGSVCVLLATAVFSEDINRMNARLHRRSDAGVVTRQYIPRLPVRFRRPPMVGRRRPRARALPFFFLAPRRRPLWRTPAHSRTLRRP